MNFECSECRDVFDSLEKATDHRDKTGHEFRRI